MELGIVMALGYWGYKTGDNATTKTLLLIGTPLLGFGVWGVVDFRQAGSLAEPFRLIEELIISGLATAALFASGAEALAWALGLISIIHHILVYVLGGRLLKH